MISVMSQEGSFQRTIPVHSASQLSGTQSSGPMDGVSNTSSNNAPPPQVMDTTPTSTQDNSGTTGASSQAQQQPSKLGQNVFVHKLYNMLEDSSISHLISWSSTNDSFVISPNAEFAKACSTYFKHTNISSFVRQLNMYGFHKVSDVFHNGSTESPLWEFRHREGAFRRGDFARLSAVKRRASRQALPHRNSFSTAPRVQQQQPQQPLPPVGQLPEPVTQDPLEMRLMSIEHSLHEAHHQIARSQEANNALSSRCQMLSDNLGRAYQYNLDLSSFLLRLISDPNAQIHHEVSAMHGDISRNLESMRHVENGHPPEPPNAFHRPSVVQTHLENGPPLSPFQLAQDDQRRGSLFSRQIFSRPGMPQRSTTETTRRYDPITNGSGRMSPPLRPALLDPLEPRIPPINELQPSEHSHPGSHVSPPAFPRRHTFADIRPHAQAWPSSDRLPLPGYNNAQQSSQHAHASPFTSGNSSTNWPSSPNRTPNSNQAGEQQRIQDSLANFRMPAPHSSVQRKSNTPPSHSGPTILPALNGLLEGAPASLGNGSSANGSNGVSSGPSSSVNWGPSRSLFKDVFASSDPPTRRSSMAHLLNPADTAERSDEDDVGPDDLRKRKRVG